MVQKVAYVTGGMGGIGTAICQRLHKEGFKVIAGCGPTRDFGKWLDEQKAQQLGLKPLARIAAFATTGLDPATMGMGPVSASRRALQRAGWNAQDVNLFELNEAFAAQACAVNKELGLDPSKVNVNGGAIAIGHPLGCSGARITTTLLHELRRRGVARAAATMCIGVGQGIASLWEGV